MSPAVASRRGGANPPPTAHHANLPRYELRLSVASKSDYQLEIWQLPSPATPRLTGPEYVASLKAAGAS